MPLTKTCRYQTHNSVCLYVCWTHEQLFVFALEFYQGYLMQRIHSSAEIQSNVSLSNGRLDNTALAKLISHLKTLSKGSYLYLKLTLDLIEGGYLVLKSSSFKVRQALRKDVWNFIHSYTRKTENCFLFVCLCCLGGSCESCRGLSAAAQHEVSYPVIISKGSATAQHHCGIPASSDRPKGKYTITVCVHVSYVININETRSFLTAPPLGSN